MFTPIRATCGTRWYLNDSANLVRQFVILSKTIVLVVGDILADTIEDVDDAEEGENKGGLKAKMIETEAEAKSHNLDDISMPVIGSKIT